MLIPFAEWLPDIQDLNNPGATRADNVIPAKNSYLQMNQLATFSTSLGGRCQGAIFARDSATNVYNYAGDASALYSLVGTTYSVATRLVGGAYQTPTTDYWEFIPWAQTVIAVNGTDGDVPQVISLGAANFTALGGSPPKARHIAVVRDFVVMGNISDSAVGVQAVRWSAINNAGSWTPDATTMADFQDLPGDGGWVQKVVGGESGIIFQERAVWRMTFVGSPLIFQFDRIHAGIGAIAPQSVVNYMNAIFFLAPDGFYMFDGSDLQAIGRGKVDRTFFNDVDTDNIERVVGAIDPFNKLVAWAYPASGNANGNPNVMLIYSWAFQRWSRVTGLNVELILQNMASGLTLDQLDSINTSIDALGFSLDSRRWTGGSIFLGAFNSGHRLQRFDGSAMAATVETAEYNFTPGFRSTINEITPVVQGQSASAQVAIVFRNVQTQSTSATTALGPNSTGIVNIRNTARYQRVRLTTSAGVPFDHLIGVDITPIKEGMR